MDSNPYLLIPLVSIIIAQIVHWARTQLPQRTLTLRPLIRKSPNLSPITAFASGLLAVSLTVGGIDNVLIGFAVLGVWLVVLQQDGFQRRDQFWTTASGFVGAFLLTAGYWSDSAAYIFEQPPESESVLLFRIFLAIILIGVILIAWSRRGVMRKLPTARRLERAFRVTIVAPAVFGLFVAFLQSQTENDFMTQRVYAYLVFVIIAAGTLWAIANVYRQAPDRLREERRHFLAKKLKKKSKRKTKRGRRKR